MKPFYSRLSNHQMDHLIEDILRQRKLLLWRKILETFPIEKKHREQITKKILPQSVVDLPQHTVQPQSDALLDNKTSALHCSGTDM